MAARAQYNETLHYDNEPRYAADRSSAPSPFKIDEGFSEETRSQTASDAAFGPDPIPMDDATDDVDMQSASTQWILAQPALVRAHIARDLLASLPNSLLSQLVHEANGRLHLDPVRCLPQEIVSSIFELLDSKDLVQASLVSKLWTAFALEPRLWRRLFGLEGWTHDAEKLRSFERKSQFQIRGLWSDQKVRRRSRGSAPNDSDARRSAGQNTKGEANAPENLRLWVKSDGWMKIPQEWVYNATSSNIAQYGDWRSSNQTVTPSGQFDEEMTDVADGNETTAGDGALGQTSSLSAPDSPVCPLLNPSHLRDTADETPQPNWHWLYKQRRRLEGNWNAGRYKNFRLPLPAYHAAEAHAQCVYAIQFTTRHLVSGSRDRSIRIWDLNTQRLKLPALTGHEGSVLCLQFDESPQQDVIISGGSDSAVIIWKFSTGAMLKRLAGAHTESVLNLRFDNRYLVTCSKDKTIKLWNRRELRPGDSEYPQTNMSPNAYYPAYIINMQDEMTTGPFDPLEPYTLLTTFDQHNAAVNAIQIFENEIVSASGDRKIMLWDIRTGSLIRTFIGHTKGIACVQYDGRRIISGSSDNSVRIFDSATAAQVAVLDGHENLVRTVQGDFCENDEIDYEAEARENDKQITEKKARSLTTGEAPAWDDNFVFGAKLPPSGGGNRWSKIVSGSYDETVIIWRKDETGKWFPAKQLRQEDAMIATAPPGEARRTIPVDISESTTRSGFVRIYSGPPFNLSSSAHHIFQQAQAVGMPHNLSTRDGIQWMQRNLLLSRTSMGLFQFFRIRFWNNLPSQNSQQPVAQGPLEGALAAVNPLGAPNGAGNAVQPEQQEEQPQNAPPAHLHPSHPHYLYQLSPQMLPGNTHRQIPAIPRISAQLRQPQLQIQLHNRLTQHILQSCRDVDLPPGPSNLPTPWPSQFLPPQNGSTSQGASAEPTQVLNNVQADPATTAPQAHHAHQSHQPQPLHMQPPPILPEIHHQPVAQQDQQQQQQPQNAPLPQQGALATAARLMQQQAQGGPEGGLSRVFKLQFDSRRIICCSQQATIVGWDFANGDSDIEEASQFFDVDQ